MPQSDSPNPSLNDLMEAWLAEHGFWFEREWGFAGRFKHMKIYEKGTLRVGWDIDYGIIFGDVGEDGKGAWAMKPTRNIEDLDEWISQK